MRSTTWKCVALGVLWVGAPLAAGLAMLTTGARHDDRDAEQPLAILHLARDARAVGAHNPVGVFDDVRREPCALRLAEAVEGAPRADEPDPDTDVEIAPRWFRVHGVVLLRGEPLSGVKVGAVGGPSPWHRFRCGTESEQADDEADAGEQQFSVLGALLGARSSASTDDDGRFELFVEAQERVWIVASPARGQHCEPVAVRVVADSTQPLVLHVPTSGASVQGRVAGARAGIAVHAPLGSPAFTDHEGRFTLQDVPLGDTVIHACAVAAQLEAMPRTRQATDATDARALFLAPGGTHSLVLDGVFLRDPDRSKQDMRDFSQRCRNCYRGPPDAGPDAIRSGG